jgi:threonine/homoserine/homoserine lactone efflux protein
VLVIILPQRCPRLPASGHLAAQLITLNLISPITALVLDYVWALAAGTASQSLSRSPRRLAATGGTGGLAMIGTGGLAMVGLGVSLAATARKD